MTQPSVAVLILTHNNQDDITSCIDGVVRQAYPACRVLILDNASSDATLHLLPGRFRKHARRNPVNVGFAEGMNQLLAEVVEEYVVLLNADCVLLPGFIESAVAELERRPRAAAVAPLVWRRADTSTRTVDGGPLGISWLMRVQHLGEVETSRWVLKPNGSCPVYRMSALREVGRTSGYLGFDVLYDTYGEDIDLALRIARCGWGTWYSPATQAVHRRSGSTGAVSILAKRGRLRTNVLAGRYFNAAAHHPCWLIPFAVLTMLSQDLALVLLRLSRGDRLVVTDVIHAWIRVLRHARHKRAEVRKCLVAPSTERLSPNGREHDRGSAVVSA